MPRKSIGGRPMSDAERQARHRAALRGRHDGHSHAPSSRSSRPGPTTGQWTELQAQYAVWLEALPDNLQDGATADALRAICELDLAELQAAESPRGFGRD